MEASQKYYTDGSSDVSDKQFDEMLDQLKEEDPNSPLLSNTGHGYNVSDDSTSGEKIKHRYGEAGSLDKCHNWKELESTLKGENGLWASLKLDGLSVVMYYENGDLVRALTRGDGITGIDVTDKVKFIYNGFTELYDEYFTGAVRGEIIMSYKNFELFQEIHPEAKNPRNSAVGIINRDGISEDLRFLDIVVYTVVGRGQMAGGDETEFEAPKYTDMTYWLVTNFAKCAPIEKVYLNENNMIDEMKRLQSNWYGEYPADGIVLTSDNLQAVRKNETDIEVIYLANAFKFKAESAVTKVVGVEWSLSKTKYLIPRIKFETVQLSGTNVSYCAGNNAKYIKDMGIDVGAEIEVLKSGEIIPYLESVVSPIADPTIPTHCPCCGAELVWNGVHLACPNRECADADIQDVLVWMQCIAPYDGLGDILKLKFLSTMFGDDISIDKIYQSGPRINLGPSGYVKLDNFYDMYNRLFYNKVELADAIRALNIPRFGDVTSARLAEYPKHVMTLMYAAEHPQIPLDTRGFEKEIGVANCESLAKHYHKFKRLNYIKDNINFDVPKVEHKGKVAITGKLSVKRSVFEAELKAAGYTPGSIAKDTKYLITDDPNSSTDKNKKADEWHILKITEADFRAAYLSK